MKLYIDYENVSRKGLEGITRLTAEDSVRIYYSGNIEVLSVPKTKALVVACRLPDVIKKMNFHNALDIVLLNDIYRVIDGLNGDRMYVITKDKGFDAVIGSINEHLRYRTVWRCTSIFEASMMDQSIRKDQMAARRLKSAPPAPDASKPAPAPVVMSQPAPAAVSAPMPEQRYKCRIDQAVLEDVIMRTVPEFFLLCDAFVEAIAPAETYQDAYRRLRARYDRDIADRFMAAAKPCLRFVSAS